MEASQRDDLKAELGTKTKLSTKASSIAFMKLNFALSQQGGRL